MKSEWNVATFCDRFGFNFNSLDFSGFVSINMELRLIIYYRLKFDLIWLTNLIPKFKNLKTLDLSGQGYDSLPTNLSNLSSLEMLKWNDNPLKTIPEFIKNGTFNQMMDYLRSLEKGAISWNQIKLLVVGQPASGKTSLIKCLKNSFHKLEKNDNLNIATNGIEISQWISDITVCFLIF